MNDPSQSAFVNSGHRRTVSTSIRAAGGNRRESMIIYELKEENKELTLKLQCLKGTIKILNGQIMESKEKLERKEFLWETKEKSLTIKVKHLVNENNALKESLVKKRKELNGLSKNYENLHNMYEHQEISLKHKNMTIALLKSQADSNIKGECNDEARSINENSISLTEQNKKVIRIKSDGETNIRKKKPQVKMITKGTFRNPTHDLFE